ncbi:hypothetical protein [Escherichia coli]|nr:hypothetical protein [Escherichia coli]HBD5274921.1 hypothetical protein [Escherichia coli]HBD5472981.1 hypothetical protein [Escherichia coli]
MFSKLAQGSIKAMF